jgi:hypothetical protein
VAHAPLAAAVLVMKRFFRENGLTLAMLALFVLCWVGQGLSGWKHHNEEQRDHGNPEVALREFLGSGTFIESTFENWESEFLQMAAFVLLAAKLKQKGSGESKPLEGEEDVDKDPRTNKKKDSPAPVHRGGLALKLYSHSLSMALLALFVFSFFMHAVGGRRQFNEEALEHGQQTVTLLSYLGSSTFWFESFQNWQSEFLSVAALVVLSIFLRERGSPESKPVHAPHSETGR